VRPYGAASKSTANPRIQKERMMLAEGEAPALPSTGDAAEM
jgi:hypothetical protein